MLLVDATSRYLAHGRGLKRTCAKVDQGILEEIHERVLHEFTIELIIKRACSAADSSVLMI